MKTDGGRAGQPPSRRVSSHKALGAAMGDVIELMTPNLTLSFGSITESGVYLKAFNA